jgi:surface antigen/LysM repeat protein
MRNGHSITSQNKPKLRVTIERLTKASGNETFQKTSSTQRLGAHVHRAVNGLRHAGVDTLFTYPATRLARLPWQKLALRFTDECLLITLGLLLIVGNLFLSPKKDNSLFAVALSRHAKRNTSLYTALFNTTTTITPNGFIAEAQADEQLTAPAGRVAGASVQASSLTTIDDQGLSAALPDSTKAFLSNQVRVHETQSGETLASIADKYDLKVNTIKWSNNLTSDTIKPGWFLVIPSIDGVLVQADNDTTIAGISRKFKCSEEKIISYNGLDGADSVEPGQYIMCPDGVLTAPPAPPKTPSKTRSVGVNYASIPDLPGTVNSFVKGNCTWYVAKRMKITFHGNAKDWLRNAPGAGYKTGHVPMAGSAVVVSLSGRYGHVAYVEAVHDNGTITISEMNYKGLGVKSSRTIGADEVKGYIYPRD